jgi:hypothetical protein
MPRILTCVIPFGQEAGKNLTQVSKTGRAKGVLGGKKEMHIRI